MSEEYPNIDPEKRYADFKAQWSKPEKRYLDELAEILKQTEIKLELLDHQVSALFQVIERLLIESFEDHEVSDAQGNAIRDLVNEIASLKSKL